MKNRGGMQLIESVYEMNDGEAKERDDNSIFCCIA